jgi:uncharacterized protein YjbI with pentapeptide repeats
MFGFYSTVIRFLTLSNPKGITLMQISKPVLVTFSRLADKELIKGLLSEAETPIRDTSHLRRHATIPVGVHFLGANYIPSVDSVLITNGEITNGERITFETPLGATISSFKRFLAPAYFQDLNLEGAQLAGVDLSGANLRFSSLNGANLTGANLQNTQLSFSDLSNTQLPGANLSNSESMMAKFIGANATRANLSNAILRIPDFTGADFTGADFTGANLQRLNRSQNQLNGANFTGANFTGANLTKANFTGADLTGAQFQGSKGYTP